MAGPSRHCAAHYGCGASTRSLHRPRTTNTAKPRVWNLNSDRSPTRQRRGEDGDPCSPSDGLSPRANRAAMVLPPGCSAISMTCCREARDQVANQPQELETFAILASCQGFWRDRRVARPCRKTYNLTLRTIQVRRRPFSNLLTFTGPFKQREQDGGGPKASRVGRIGLERSESPLRRLSG